MDIVVDGKRAYAATGGRAFDASPAQRDVTEIDTDSAVILQSGVANQEVGVPDVRGAMRDQADASSTRSTAPGRCVVTMTLSLLDDACVSIPSLPGTAGQGRSARPQRTKVLPWRHEAAHGSGI